MRKEILVQYFYGLLADDGLPCGPYQYPNDMYYEIGWTLHVLSRQVTVFDIQRYRASWLEYSSFCALGYWYKELGAEKGTCIQARKPPGKRRPTCRAGCDRAAMRSLATNRNISFPFGMRSDDRTKCDYRFKLNEAHQAASHLVDTASKF